MRYGLLQNPRPTAPWMTLWTPNWWACDGSASVICRTALSKQLHALVHERSELANMYMHAPC